MSSRPAAGATQQSSSSTSTSQDSTDSVDIKEASDAVLNFTCDDIIDEVLLGVCFEIHRAVKMGTFFLNDVDEASEKEYEIVDEIGLDVFGQVPMKKQLECVCPNCQRNLAASRFAPHLEKCMGMGRSSSRIANRRIANTSCSVLKDSSASGANAGCSSGLGGGASTSTAMANLSDQDDENDDDWTYNSDRKGPKKKKEKNTNHTMRRPKTSKMKNGETSSASYVSCSSESATASSYPNYENMSVDDRKVLLVQMCGVISEHTRRMCTRSHRCPQHTDDQRKAVRVTLLGSQLGSSLETNDDVQVETLDDVDGQLLRADNLWESSMSANPSPTDSTSTNNSTASTKKRDKRSKNGTPKCSKKPRPQKTKVTSGGTTIAAGGTAAGSNPAPPPPPSTTHEQCS